MMQKVRIRDEDYWIFTVLFLNVVCGAAAIYVGVLVYRLLSLILYLFTLWLLMNKIRRDYSLGWARIFVGISIMTSLVVAYFGYILTN